MTTPPLTLHDTSLEVSLYAEWKRHGRHLKEYASEFVGTAFLLFCVVGFVSLMFAPSSPVSHWIHSVYLRLLCAGLLIGSSGWLVAVSPPGRLSGGHINPAVSFGFWLLGKMHTNDLGGYILAQMSGAVVGAFAAQLVFSAWAREIQLAVLAPLPGMSPAAAFLAEVLSTFALISVLFFCVSHKNIAGFTPAVMTLASGILVCLDGHLSGAGMNPARWFGPAFIQKFWTLGWVYWGAPCFGAFLAAAPRRLGLYSRHMPATAKIVHDSRFRSIFPHDDLPTSLPKSVERARSKNH